MKCMSFSRFKQGIFRTRGCKMIKEHIKYPHLTNKICSQIHTTKTNVKERGTPKPIQLANVIGLS